MRVIAKPPKAHCSSGDSPTLTGNKMKAVKQKCDRDYRTARAGRGRGWALFGVAFVLASCLLSQTPSTAQTNSGRVNSAPVRGGDALPIEQSPSECLVSMEIQTSEEGAAIRELACAFSCSHPEQAPKTCIVFSPVKPDSPGCGEPELIKQAVRMYEAFGCEPIFEFR